MVKEGCALVASFLPLRLLQTNKVNSAVPVRMENKARRARLSFPVALMVRNFSRL